VSTLSSLLISRAWLEAAPAGLAGVLGTAPLNRGSANGLIERSAVPLKLVLSISLLGVLGYSEFRKPPADVVTSTPGPDVATLSGLALGSADSSGLVDAKLPGGSTLRIHPNGIEENLLTSIASRPAAGIDPEKWFSCDRLEFEPDSAVLKPASKEQVRNIAEILRAFPRVNLRVRANRSEDSDLGNKSTFSEYRAKGLVNALVSLGIDRNRLSSTADGDSRLPSDSSEDDRSHAQIAISIIRK
jgi:hypothetical protein